MNVLIFLGIICLLFGGFILSAALFDPYTCSKCGDKMEKHICGHLHCNNPDCDNILP